MLFFFKWSPFLGQGFNIHDKECVDNSDSKTIVVETETWLSAMKCSKGSLKLWRRRRVRPEIVLYLYIAGYQRNAFVRHIIQFEYLRKCLLIRRLKWISWVICRMINYARDYVTSNKLMIMRHSLQEILQFITSNFIIMYVRNLPEYNTLIRTWLTCLQLR